MKKRLNGIDELKFLFTSPTFTTDKLSNQKREFYIPRMTREKYVSAIYMPQQSIKWREYLISFAKSVGKPDAEVYVDTGKWKARQGGNGVVAANDVKIKYTNCTAEENAKIHQLYKPFDDSSLELFIPFGKVSKELGKKLINETIVLDLRTNTPILSITPFTQDGYEYSVKVKTMNVAKHDDL